MCLATQDYRLLCWFYIMVFQQHFNNSDVSSSLQLELWNDRYCFPLYPLLKVHLATEEAAAFNNSSLCQLVLSPSKNSDCCL